MKQPSTRLILAGRIRAIREELFGAEGGSSLAEAMRVPYQTWLDYESGLDIPALILLRFVAITTVHPHWLLTGNGDKFVSRTRVRFRKQGFCDDGRWRLWAYEDRGRDPT